MKFRLTNYYIRSETIFLEAESREEALEKSKGMEAKDNMDEQFHNCRLKELNKGMATVAMSDLSEGGEG